MNNKNAGSEKRGFAMKWLWCLENRKERISLEHLKGSIDFLQAVQRLVRRGVISSTYKDRKL